MGFDFNEILKGLNRYARGARQELKTAKEKAIWVWEALQGDFNPNRSMGQVGLDMGVCLIPGIDTVMDIRDLIANIIAIARAPTSGFAWFSLILTIVGFIPELGSVAKGVVKLVLIKLRPLLRHVDDLTDTSKVLKAVDQAFDESLIDIMAYLRDPQVQKFLTKSRIPDVVKEVARLIRLAAAKVNPSLLKALFTRRANDLKAILDDVGRLLPSNAENKIAEIKQGVATVQRSFNSQTDRFAGPVKAVMERIAQRLDDMYWVAYTQQVNKGWIAPLSEQGARKLISKHRPAWVKNAIPVEFPPLNPPKFERSRNYINGRKLGAPKLASYEIESFAAVATRPVKARQLKEGETLYRIVDPTSRTFSTCWVTEDVWQMIQASANPRATWRGRLAVKPEWNQNGQFISYTYNRARDGEVVVWEGPTAMQKLSGADYLEGGLDQVVFHPKEQLEALKSDEFVSAQFPDLVEGGAIRNADGTGKPSGVRKKINDPRIQGPYQTGWGYKDFEDQHSLVGLPNPNRTK